MAYVTATILREALGAAKVDALVPTAPDLARTIRLAEAEVEGALQVGGYTGAVPATVYLPDASNCPSLIQLAAVGAWVRIAYGRHDVPIPEDLRGLVQTLESFRTGALEVPDVTKASSRAVGGVLFSSPSARPQIFGRKSMRGF